MAYDAKSAAIRIVRALDGYLDSVEKGDAEEMDYERSRLEDCIEQQLQGIVRHIARILLQIEPTEQA